MSFRYENLFLKFMQIQPHFLVLSSKSLWFLYNLCAFNIFSSSIWWSICQLLAFTSCSFLKSEWKNLLLSFGSVSTLVIYTALFLLHWFLIDYIFEHFLLFLSFFLLSSVSSPDLYFFHHFSIKFTSVSVLWYVWNAFRPQRATRSNALKRKMW